MLLLGEALAEFEGSKRRLRGLVSAQRRCRSCLAARQRMHRAIAVFVFAVLLGLFWLTSIAAALSKETVIVAVVAGGGAQIARSDEPTNELDLLCERMFTG
jgi:hypothetical protein